MDPWFPRSVPEGGFKYFFAFFSFFCSFSYSLLEASSLEVSPPLLGQGVLAAQYSVLGAFSRCLVRRWSSHTMIPEKHKRAFWVFLETTSIPRENPRTQNFAQPRWAQPRRNLCAYAPFAGLHSISLDRPFP